MKALTLLGSPVIMIYAAFRWEWLQYLLIALFIGGGTYLILYSIYQHLRANRFHL